MGSRVRVGTSGWQYDHWRGDFYPKELPKRTWFDHYAGVFDTVELNNSFYRQPKDAAWDRWREIAPCGFRFAVKANRFLTHIKRLKDVEESIERFIKGVRRLEPALGPLLYQLPPNFTNNSENCSRLESFLTLLPKQERHVVEFRHDSWHTDEVLGLLKRHDVGFCCHDMQGLHPPIAVTSTVGYVRLHGRRYGGNYGATSLQSWAQHVSDMQRDADEVWVYFNNDIGGYAPKNAQSLRQLLN